MRSDVTGYAGVVRLIPAGGEYGLLHCVCVCVARDAGHSVIPVEHVGLATLVESLLRSVTDLPWEVACVCLGVF